LPSLIAGIGEQRLQEHPNNVAKQQDAAVAILDIGGMNDGVAANRACLPERGASCP
jgi:hypothetical protein